MPTTITPPELREDMERLEDLFINAAVPFAVSGEDGELLLFNRAVERLVGHAPANVADVLGGPAERDRVLGLLTAAGTVIRDVSAPGSEGGMVVTVDAAPAAEHIHWSFRPVLTGAVPQAPTVGGGTDAGDAGAWIERLGPEVDVAALAGVLDPDERARRHALMSEFFDRCPAAIHLVAADGRVLAANPTEIAILGFADAPERYVGRHIGQIYPDPLTIEDLLWQMSSGAPTVNVRAQLQNTAGDVLSVVVYSSSRIVGDTFANTRCIVYPDGSPDPRPTRLRMFDWPSAS